MIFSEFEYFISREFHMLMGNINISQYSNEFQINAKLHSSNRANKSHQFDIQSEYVYKNWFCIIVVMIEFEISRNIDYSYSLSSYVSLKIFYIYLYLSQFALYLLQYRTFKQYFHFACLIWFDKYKKNSVLLDWFIHSIWFIHYMCLHFIWKFLRSIYFGIECFAFDNYNHNNRYVVNSQHSHVMTLSKYFRLEKQKKQKKLNVNVSRHI